MSDKLIIHHLVKSCSERIVWLAEEMGIDYDLIVHHRDPATLRAPAAMKQLSPFGKAPVIQHGVVVVSESAAVIDYLLDEFDPDHRFRPAPRTQAFRDYRFWMYATEATMKTPLTVDIVNSMTGTEGTPPLKQFLREENVPVYEYMSKVLSEREYVAGDFSGADPMLWYVLRIAANANMPGTVRTVTPLTNYPAILAYMDRLAGRPAYQKAARLCAVEPT